MPPATRCQKCRHDRGPLNMIRIVVDGVQHSAPEAWLMGRSQAHERDGAKPAAAYLAAVRDWAEQCTLAPTED
jgi:hypothetical protein